MRAYEQSWDRRCQFLFCCVKEDRHRVSLIPHNKMLKLKIIIFITFLHIGVGNYSHADVFLSCVHLNFCVR